MMKPEILGEGASFEGMPYSYFLIELLNEFNNRFQAAANAFFKKISWKQCFLLTCITYFKEPPVIKQLAELIGCSHQNTKQILLKLEKSGYVRFLQDKTDKRKQRVILTEQAEAFQREHNKESAELMAQLFLGINAPELKTTMETIIKLHVNLKAIEEKQDAKISEKPGDTGNNDLADEKYQQKQTERNADETEQKTTEY